MRAYPTPAYVQDALTPESPHERLPEAGRSSRPDTASRLRLAVLTVAGLNLAYFFVEFGVARAIASVALFADSIDFLEDASINLLILMALGWPARRRAAVGMVLAVILMVPGLFTLWQVWQKFSAPIAPEASLLTAAGVGALVVNLTCAYILAQFRAQSGSLTKAAWLASRNDAIANVAIIGSGLATLAMASHWPDLLVGIGIFLMNLDAAKDVFEAARHERASAPKQ